MAQVEVRILRKAKEVERVTRPVHFVDGKPYVKYKRRLWPLANGGEVRLDGAEALGAEEEDGHDPVSEFQVVPPALIEWDESQRRVIDAPAEERLLVGAGPGTGKTAVACGRVSQLIDQYGLEPSRVWLISFTRTAVQEIRDRIAAYLEDASAAYAVKIATLDSHAWTIHSGFDEGTRLLGSYEENIGHVLQLVRQDVDVADYLEGVEHLIVDEAQDIVGTRADLVVELVRKMSSSCGVTVFADEAQAIYGFADAKEIRSDQIADAPQPPFPSRIRSGTAGPFRECELTEVHRTSSSQLLTIFSDTRRKVLTAAGKGEDKLAEIRDQIISLAHGEAPAIDGAALAKLEDTFVLYRRRSDVLLTSSILAQNGVAHRVRMSGLPVCLAPWIGAALSGHANADLDRERFMELWDENVRGTALATCGAGEAWTRLVRIGGRTDAVLDMRLLRQRLGRKQPPAEVCDTAVGVGGPIVGTIHASKGREADTVHLMLPDTQGAHLDQDEEARVVFVGATRGRAKLLVGRGYRQHAGRVDVSGRVFCLQTRRDSPRAQFEIGRDTDIDAEGLAGRHLFASTEAVWEGQRRILGIADEPAALVAVCDRDVDFLYRLSEDGSGRCLAVLSRSVNNDLFFVANALQAKLGGGRRRPPDVLRHLHVRGVRTVVLPPDAPEGELLHEPWRSSGIMMAPLVLGYTTSFFPLIGKRQGR